jgi:hypothetical protein
MTPAQTVKLNGAQNTVARRAGEQPEQQRRERRRRPPPELQADHPEQRVQSHEQQDNDPAEHDHHLQHRVLLGFLIRPRTPREQRVRPARRTIHPAPITPRP